MKEKDINPAPADKEADYKTNPKLDWTEEEIQKYTMDGTAARFKAGVSNSRTVRKWAENSTYGVQAMKDGTGQWWFDPITVPDKTERQNNAGRPKGSGNPNIEREFKQLKGTHEELQQKHESLLINFGKVQGQLDEQRKLLPMVHDEANQAREEAAAQKSKLETVTRDYETTVAENSNLTKMLEDVKQEKLKLRRKMKRRLTGAIAAILILGIGFGWVVNMNNQSTNNSSIQPTANTNIDKSQEEVEASDIKTLSDLRFSDTEFNNP